MVMRAMERGEVVLNARAAPAVAAARRKRNDDMVKDLSCCWLLISDWKEKEGLKREIAVEERTYKFYRDGFGFVWAPPLLSEAAEKWSHVRTR